MESQRLRVGDIVEVREQEEILKTLDDGASLDGVVFMPEMFAYRGRRLRVHKIAHKTCDTINYTGLIRLMNTVHLEDIRCDGSSHGGCEAECLIYWKEAWLQRVDQAELQLSPSKSNSSCGVDDVGFATRKRKSDSSALEKGVDQYRCQVTDILLTGTHLPWWDLSQYYRDVHSGNYSLWAVIRGVSISLFNKLQRRRKAQTYPWTAGRVTGKTPSEKLDLQPGEWVEIKSLEEIRDTLNEEHKNRGLWFDVEMVPFCGRKYQVHKRVEKIIDERTGKMMRLPNDCIMLKNVTCGGELSADPHRLFCPRAIPPYWREIWLRRVD